MDDDIFQFEVPADIAPELVLGKKKKKKKKKKDDSASKQPEGSDPATNGHGAGDPAAGHEAPTSAFSALDVEAESVPLVLGKKKKKKQKGKDVTEVTPPEPEEEDEPLDAEPTSAFAALDIDDEDDNSGVEEDDFAMASTAAKKKKKNKKNKKALALPDPLEENVLQTLEQGEEKDSVEVKRPMTAAEKKKARKERERLAKEEKAKKEKDELDALLAELDGPNPDASGDQSVDSALHPEPEAPAPSGKKKKKKGKGNATAANDDIDGLLAELAEPEPTPKEGNEVKPAADVDNLLAELGGVGDAPAAKKKPKKKKKKGAAKADDEAEGGAGEAASAASETKKPKKKESALVRKMREQREKMLAEQERLRKQEEEEARRIAEEQRKREEEEKRKAEEKARRKAAEKAKRERKRQEGTLLSKAEKERRRKAEAFRQQMIAMGRVPAVSHAENAEGSEKVVYARKKKTLKSKENETSAVEQDQKDVDLNTKESSDTHEAEKPVEAPQPEPEPEVIPDAWDELPDFREDNESTKVVDKSKNADEKELLEKPEGKESDEGSDEEETDEDDSEDSEDSEYEGMSKAEIAAEKKLEAIRRKRAKEKNAAMAARTREHLRSPVICILGHVDTGKTKILDRIRRTNVQDAEAGGITQQIGATYFPIEAVKKEATKLEEGRKLLYNVPSLLIIDTPGHESFTNLRSRGSSLCDIAILVVDIMHGLEPQTRESIDLLKMRKTPFIVALNKIDRMYDWQAQPHNCPTRTSIEKQPRHVQEEFLRRTKETKLQFAEIGFNTELYWENKDMRKTVSLVPTSAITGEGMPDLLMLLLALPQKLLTDRLMFSPILEATVLEVKVIEGLGTTIDIILTGGTIHEGDTIMVVGLDGPIVTTIRALLTPHPMKEMRVKGQYLHHKEIKAAQGIKISADGLEKAVAGTQLMVVEDPSDEQEMEYVREEVMKDFQTILTNVDRSGLGVYVQASTLGSLEALLEYLRSTKIPVSGINIGPVHKRDVTKASTMLEKQKEYATILAFDVPVEKEAREMAEDVGVQIFTADIIYHLFDQFTAYMEKIKKERREAVNDEVVFPVIAKILPQHVYNKKDPIVVGVDVMEGILRVGTPLVVRHGVEWLDIGRVVSIELNKKQVPIAKKGESVAVKIQHKNTEHIMYGRHFDFQDQLVSKMSRSAIELLKASFKEDLETEDWRLVVKLKKMFQIV